MFMLSFHLFLPHHSDPSDLGVVQDFSAKFATGGSVIKRKVEAAHELLRSMLNKSAIVLIWRKTWA